jgi:GNAT superfamily N-acetyltransferase
MVRRALHLEETMVSLSALDRERFGLVTARAPHFTGETLGEALRFCRTNDVQMLIGRCAAEDLSAAQAMEAAGGQLMDVLVYWVRALDRIGPEEATSVPVRPSRPSDVEAVRAVAAASFRGYFGHYHADQRLDRAKCDEVYASWAERSCLDPDVASRVLVAEHEGRVAGFLTLLGRGPEEQEIILNGVDPAVQRQGTYRALVLAAVGHARADGARRLTVSTQLINIGVQKTWARLGFEPSRSYLTFHLWFDGD